MTAPRVSVVIPTFNRKEWVREAVVSVVGQTHAPVEILVVDNGSTDGTLDALREFGDRVRCLRLERPDLSEARNAGARAGRGDLIAFLDNDDLWRPDKLEKQTPLFADPATALVYSDARFFRRPGPPLGRYHELHPPREGRVAAALFWDLFVHPSTMIVRRSAMEEAGFFDPRFAIAEEYDWLLRVARRGAFRCVPEPLAEIRLHGANASREKRVRLWEEVLEICGAASTWQEIRGVLGPRVEGRLAMIEGALALENARARNWSSAGRWALRAGARGARPLAWALAAHLRAFARYRGKTK